MIRLQWPENPEEKQRAQHAADALSRDSNFETLLDLVVRRTMAIDADAVMEADPAGVELPRKQGANQVMKDLLTISQDARQGLGRPNQRQPPTARPTGGTA